jgi:predicted nucleic acid-binding protein
MVTAAELLVVDASVACKWHLPDETDAEIAMLLLDRFADGEVQLIAPQHIRSEVPSAITVATRGKQTRLTPEQGEAAIEEFLAIGVRTIDDDSLVRATYAAARQYDCAFYDGLYLALAHRLGVRFVLADDRFYARINQLPFVVWISDYT